MDAAARLARLAFQRNVERQELLHELLGEAELSPRVFAGSQLLNRSAERRLAFRELGLSIGIHAFEQTGRLAKRGSSLTVAGQRLLEHVPLAEQIERFWCEPDHRRTAAWREHADINAVMLATSLAPDGYVRLQPESVTSATDP